MSELDLAVGGARLTARVALGWRSAVALIVVGWLAIHLWTPPPADTSWLLTVCERMLAGETLYRDIEVVADHDGWIYKSRILTPDPRR